MRYESIRALNPFSRNHRIHHRANSASVLSYRQACIAPCTNLVARDKLNANEKLSGEIPG